MDSPITFTVWSSRQKRKAGNVRRVSLRVLRVRRERLSCADLSGLVPDGVLDSGYLSGRGRQSSIRRFLQRHSRTRSRGPFLIVVPAGRCTPRRRRQRTCIAKDDRQTVFAAPDDDRFCIRGLRKLKRRLDAAPAQIGIRNALADSLLKIAYAFCLDLLAFRLAFLTLDPKFIFLRDVVLLNFSIDGGNYGRGQLNASHKYVIED